MKDKNTLLVLLLVFVILAAGIVAAGGRLYRSQQDNYQTEVEHKLTAVADLKVDELSMWRKERLADAGVFYKNSAFSALLRRSIERSQDLPLHEELRTWIGRFQVSERYNRIALLDAFAAIPENIALLIDAADELGKLADAVSLVSLQRMTELKCFSSVFGFRRAVVQAMILVRLPKAVETLIDLLPKTDGEVRGDIRRYLIAVAGQIPGAGDKAWSSWWKKHKEDFHFPPPDSNPISAEAEAGTPSYYGPSIQARRIVFVIDVSGSMRGPRLAEMDESRRTVLGGNVALPSGKQPTVADPGLTQMQSSCRQVRKSIETGPIFSQAGLWQAGIRRRPSMTVVQIGGGLWCIAGCYLAFC